ncbi:hypothetical protein J4530_12055 [Neisseria subflava]|uniref:hypothetical protein n=1 Tax=Neisseria subflava TaxID=28449 RepID=UPI00202A473E|nr:hypothetical protein [Neisseria subflava]MCL9786711.1 hypothetical protein [Neisseria subflava]MCL9788230.1 hypothetical protein [Neisseria subflava]MCL9788822.1 hypothetical protein [Neisseria subflava]
MSSTIHIANVMDSSIANTHRDCTVGRIFKQVCNFRRRPHYLIEMLDGNRIICSDRVAACAEARNLSCTYFIEPLSTKKATCPPGQAT